MRALLILGTIAAAAIVSSAQAPGIMSEAQARKSAIKILLGDPYGKTQAEVASTIEMAQLVTKGRVCGGSAIRAPVWQFKIHVPAARRQDGSADDIDGMLVLDGRTGKMLCAGVPFLD